MSTCILIKPGLNLGSWQPPVGRTLKQLALRPRFGLTVIAIKRQSDGAGTVVTNIAPAADELIQAGDVLALLGSNERLNHLDQLLDR